MATDQPSQFCVYGCLMGSCGADTRRLMTALDRRGWMGKLSAALFRAQKASDRAKQYRAYSDVKYAAKDAEVMLLCGLLDGSDIPWGWGVDERGYLRDVIYIDLPTGQVSFHCPHRHSGPDYTGGWDATQSSFSNIVEFIESVLRDVEPDCTRPVRKPRPKTTFRCENCETEKASSQKVPPNWTMLHHHGDEYPVCSDACQCALAAKLNEIYYTADFAIPSGKHEGTRLSDVPEDYLFFCRDKIQQETSVLRQAASAELSRRFPKWYN